MLKAFIDWFMLEMASTIVYTTGSSFGKTAAEASSVANIDVNHTSCIRDEAAGELHASTRAAPFCPAATQRPRAAPDTATMAIANSSQPARPPLTTVRWPGRDWSNSFPTDASKVSYDTSTVPGAKQR